MRHDRFMRVRKSRSASGPRKFGASFGTSYEFGKTWAQEFRTPPCVLFSHV
jgi:hypothetical protein